MKVCGNLNLPFFLLLTQSPATLGDQQCVPREAHHVPREGPADHSADAEDCSPGWTGSRRSDADFSVCPLTVHCQLHWLT